MKNWMSNNRGLWKGIFSIILGLIMVAWPGLTTRTIILMMGIVLILIGAIQLIGFFRRRDQPEARLPLTPCISILVGICMLAMPQLFINMLMIVFGILLAIGGIDQLISLGTARRSGFPLPWFFLIAPILVLIVGLYIMFSPAISASGFMMLFGITAIIFGVIVLYDEYMLNRLMKKVKAIEAHEEESV